MWATILPIILPAIISLAGFLWQRKIISDANYQTFIDFVQAKSNQPNLSNVARMKFKKMHEDMKKISPSV
jgi:hypothetical protein